MKKPDSTEAAKLVDRLGQRLAVCISAVDQSGAMARAAIGDLRANRFSYIAADTLGAPMQNCFDLVRQAGATQAQIANVRSLTEAETPVTLGATLVQTSAIYFCLATQTQIIASMTFTSRQDVDALRAALVPPFSAAEEIAADGMAQASFMALIQLDAAVMNFLITSASPLPRMVAYQFAAILPSLVIAYRLYQDASRCDQIVQENKIVHPAFCPTAGLALSA
jgi:prophage DNA circulation protein